MTTKQTKTTNKTAPRYIINTLIFAIIAILLIAVANALYIPTINGLSSNPQQTSSQWDERYNNTPSFAGVQNDSYRFKDEYLAYRDYDVCPCMANDNSECEEWYLCKEDKDLGRKALSYYLDTAPAELLASASLAARIDTAKSSVLDAGIMSERICFVNVVYIMMNAVAGCLLLVAITYWIHNRKRA